MWRNTQEVRRWSFVPPEHTLCFQRFPQAFERVLVQSSDLPSCCVLDGGLVVDACQGGIGWLHDEALTQTNYEYCTPAIR